MTPYIPIEAWWCCLHPRERNSLVFCITNYLINPTYIERTTFDAAMAITGESSSILMLEYFMRLYGLQYQLIPCGEDCFIDAVVFVSDFWPLLAGFAVTDAFICSNPCKLLTFPQ